MMAPSLSSPRYSRGMQFSIKPRRRPRGQTSWLRALAILVPLTVIAFSPVLVADYIRLDDHANILDNPHIQRLSLAGFAAIWTKSDLGFYIPITYSIWWLYAGIANLLGTLKQSAPLFHALNLTLHIVNAFLVFSLLQTLLRFARAKPAALSEAQTRGAALIAALFFALHPAQVETVAWITELKGGLAGMLGLLGILSYYRSPRRATPAILFIAAMLSKPSAIVFPGVLLLVDRILLGKPLKDSVKAPFFFWMPQLPFVLITKYLQPDLNMEFIPSLSQRLLVAADTFSFYFCKVLFPFHLALDYGRSPHVVLLRIPGWHMALSALLTVAGVAVVIYSLWRPSQSDQDGAPAWRGFVFCGWAIFCLAIAPVLGLVPFLHLHLGDQFLVISRRRIRCFPPVHHAPRPLELVGAPLRNAEVGSHRGDRNAVLSHYLRQAAILRVNRHGSGGQQGGRIVAAHQAHLEAARQQHETTAAQRLRLGIILENVALLHGQFSALEQRKAADEGIRRDGDIPPQAEA